jgi:hypothetical protein
METDLKLILMKEELWSFVPLSTIFQLYRGGLILMDLIHFLIRPLFHSGLLGGELPYYSTSSCCFATARMNFLLKI